jgi:hypothetical protein
MAGSSRNVSSCTFDCLPYRRRDESGDPFVPLDLCAMHHASKASIEWVTPMQDGEIVPHQKITHLPLVANCKSRLSGVLPQCVKQGFALSDLRADDIAVWPAT